MGKIKTVQRKPKDHNLGCDKAESLACINQTQTRTADPDGTSLKVDAPRNERSNRVLLFGLNHQTFMHSSPPANKVPQGKKQGFLIGRVATRVSRSFRVGPQDSSYRYLTRLHHANSYQYQSLTPAFHSLHQRNRLSSATFR